MKRIFSILLLFLSGGAFAQQKHITLRASIDTAYFLTQEHFFNSIDSLVATFGPGGITQLTGDVTAGPGTGSVSATLSTVNSNVGTFGSATQVPVFTVNAKGLVTGVTNTTISGGLSVDSVAITRYGSPNPNNIRSWNTSSANGVVGSSNTTTANDSANYKIGYLSGNILSTGYGNILFGSKAAQSGTTFLQNILIGHRVASNATFTGSNNVAIGTVTSTGALGMMFNATSASRNVLIGGFGTAASTITGGALTTGTENVIIGIEAGKAVSTGSNNTAVGRGALFVSSTASQSTAIGDASLQAATAGGSTAVGYRSGGGVTSGTIDAFGSMGGQSFTTGSRNVAIGNTSFYAPSTTNTGSDNVGVGANSGAHGSSLGAIATSRNTFLGSYAGAGSITGHNDNTFLGYVSGAGSTTPGTTMDGDNNIAIGSVATLPSLTSSNQITLWVGATGGTGGYNALTRFTGGQWLLNNTTSAVTSAPNTSAALEINGTTGALILPRMTKTQRDALTAAAGMMIYQTDNTPGLRVFNGTNWMRFTETAD